MNGRMIFTPSDPRVAVPRESLAEALERVGFLGPGLPPDLPGWHNYRTGETFLQQITFMGCAPHLRFEPGESEEKFCFLRLRDPWGRPRLLHGGGGRLPRCPHCGEAHRATEEEYAAWGRGEIAAPIGCPRCGARFPPLDLTWRQTAGFSRSPLVVEDVFAGEAVPTSGFEAVLLDLGAGPWHWFYIQGRR